MKALLILLLLPILSNAQHLVNAGVQKGNGTAGAYVSYSYHPMYSPQGTEIRDVYFSFEAEGLKLSEGETYLAGSVNGYARIGEESDALLHPVITSSIGGYVAPHPAVFLQVGAGVEIKGFHAILLLKCVDHQSEYLPKYPVVLRVGYTVHW